MRMDINIDSENRMPAFLRSGAEIKRDPFDAFCDRNENLLYRFKDPIELDARKADISKEFLNTLIRFEYSHGDFFNGFDQLILYKQGSTWFLSELPSRISLEGREPFVCVISEEFLQGFLRLLYDETEIFDWKEMYNDSDVNDGYEWEISFVFGNNTVIHKYGHMLWPMSYERDIQCIVEYCGKLKEEKQNILSSEIIESYKV